MLSTEFSWAEGENNWLQVNDACCAWSVHYDFKADIFPSGPN